MSTINIGLIDNVNQYTLISINGTEIENKVISTEDLEKENLQVLYFRKELLEVAELTEIFKKIANFTPLKSFEEIQLSAEEICKKDVNELTYLIGQAAGSWSLQNNVMLLENMFEYVDHFKSLWPNDRTAFFEELWFTIKKNLSATSLKLIYNDMKSAGKSQDKNILTQVVIDGEKYPNPIDGGDFEKSLMDNYHDDFGVPFNIAEYDEEKGQLVITAVINESPVIMMATVMGLTRIQSALIATFVQALSR